MRRRRGRREKRRRGGGKGNGGERGMRKRGKVGEVEATPLTAPGEGG